MKWLRFLAIGVLLVGTFFIGLLPARNSMPVTVNYIWGSSPEVPLSWVVVASFALGFAVAAVPALYLWFRRGMVLRRYRKLNRGLEAEILQLRNLPLSPEADTQTTPSASVPAPAEAAS